MKLKHYIMRHDSANYLYVKPLQNQGLVLALLLRAQVCLYGFCDRTNLLKMMQKAGLMGGGAGVREMVRPWGAISLEVTWSRRQVDSSQTEPQPLPPHEYIFI